MAFLLSTAPSTHLLSGEARRRRDRNIEYMLSLKSENLLFSHYLEAGLIRVKHHPEGIHWGWDSPVSEIRGMLCGHWLSAAAHLIRETGHQELLGKANHIVSEIGRCQRANFGRWAFPIPQQYLYDLKRGKSRLAPQYVCHKNMMGLLDMYRFAGNQEALEIALRCADWFYDFTNEIDRETMSDMMDLDETGGIMEYWADLYEITRNEKHLELMRRYERPRLFDKLLEGVDVLTNMHANATIPEVHGYARAYEVTGEIRYRKVVEAYWDMAVTKRGEFATGGQTSGEVWTPMQKLAARLGDKNQEHCVVFNMMRLADYLLRWTGNTQYADYWEKNLYNGIFAQGYWRDDTVDMLAAPSYPETTTVAYYLPMEPGATKKWGSKTDHFWCCHCTLLQANANHHEHIYYQDGKDLIISQYLESTVKIPLEDQMLSLRQSRLSMTGGTMLQDHPVNREIENRPMAWDLQFELQADAPVSCALLFRIPGWACAPIRIFIDGKEIAWEKDARGYARIQGAWKDQKIQVHIEKELRCAPLPDRPDLVAFLDGPICLAGLTDHEITLKGDLSAPEGSLLEPFDERQWQTWRTGWKTCRQPVNFKFKPLYQIGHEAYTLYFPIEHTKEEIE